MFNQAYLPGKCPVCDASLVDNLRCCLRHSNVFYCIKCMNPRWLEKCRSCGAKRYALCFKHECAKRTGHSVCVDCWLRYDKKCQECFGEDEKESNGTG